MRSGRRAAGAAVPHDCCIGPAASGVSVRSTRDPAADMIYNGALARVFNVTESLPTHH